MGRGRRGPCSHCGTTHTPMWRNGPPDKPILCNACGSRWRIWGNLTDYVPKHANTAMINRIKNTQRSRQGNLLLSIQDSEDRKPKVRDNIASSSAGLKDDASNGSAPESAVSPNERIQLETTNGKEDSGSVQQSFWNPCIPRKKRSGLQQCMQSPVESLRRQLYNILQKPEFSKILSEEDDMLIFQNSQTSANEIGLGCVLLESTASE